MINLCLTSINTATVTTTSCCLCLYSYIQTYICVCKYLCWKSSLIFIYSAERCCCKMYDPQQGSYRRWCSCIKNTLQRRYIFRTATKKLLCDKMRMYQLLGTCMLDLLWKCVLIGWLAKWVEGWCQGLVWRKWRSRANGWVLYKNRSDQWKHGKCLLILLSRGNNPQTAS